MRPILLFITVTSLFLSNLVQGQRVRRTYVDANWQPVTSGKATFIGYTIKVSDTCWQTSYYWQEGPLNKLESFSDADRTQRHGRFAWYDDKGNVDSTGYILNGLREGDWYSYDDKFRLLLRKTFHKGILVKEYDYTMDTTKGKKPKDSTIVAASFEGGVKGWQQYLNKNLRYPIPAFKAGYQGATRIAFIVSSKGAVEDAWVFKSVERNLDEEALRLIADSPHWIPATRNDSRIPYAMNQPIIFRLR